MLHMIHWKFLLPRLVLAFLVSTAVWLGLEPVLRGFFIGVGERIIRAKIEIDEVEASLANCDLMLKGVQVANPNKPQHNLIECDTACLDVVTSGVLQRRLIVREATLSGVRFNTPRTTSGAVNLPPLVKGSLPEDFDTKLSRIGESALQEFAELLQQDLKDDLLSVELCQELSQRWPSDFKRLADQADELRKRIEAFRAGIDPSVKNVRNMAESFPDKLAEVDRLRKQLHELEEQIQVAVAQIGRDRSAIEIAKRHDEEIIRRKLAIKDLDAQSVSEYLLGEELNKHTCELVRWIKLARRYWPSEVELPENERSSGEDIIFPGMRAHPKALVERMKLDGTFQRGEQTIAWKGEITNLTTDPHVIGQPMVVRVETQGDRPLLLQATLDRTGEKPHDHIVISFPHILQPQRTLGGNKCLALNVAPGMMRVWAELDLHEETFTGRVLVEQKDLQLSTNLPPHFGQRLEQRVGVALKEVNVLQAEVLLSGSLNKPSWKLRSNMGPQIASGLNLALRDELLDRQNEMVVKLDNYLARRQMEFDKLVDAQRQEVLAKLELGSTEIDDLKQLVAGRIKLPGIGALDGLPNPFLRR